MRLLGLPLSTLAAVTLLHHHPHGPGIDYLGVFLAAGASCTRAPAATAPGADRAG